MKLVVQFFNEKDGTRSEALAGTPTEILNAMSQIEEAFAADLDNAEAPEIIESTELSLARYLDSFVIVILEQHSDDADDMRVSRIPILKRENFVNVLKEKAQ